MDQQSVYVFAKWRVKDRNLKEVLSLLQEVAKASTQEEGNLFYKAHQSSADANTLFLYEGYKDENALDAHKNSPHFQSIVVGKIVPLLEKREVVVTNELAIV